MTRILGIDPGSVITGYGVVDVEGNKTRHVKSGFLKLSKGELPVRLGEIYHQLSDIISELKPEEFAIEQVFVAKNASSALKLGQARGAAICAAASSNLDVYEYTPTQVKQAIVGRGRADKTQIQHMMGVLLGLRETLQPDQADALAVAVCHAHTRQTLQHTRNTAQK